MVSINSVNLDRPPHQIIELIKAELGLSEAELAQALAIDPRTVRRWQSGQAYPQHEARQRLANLRDVTRRLQETFASAEAIRAWIRQPSRYLSQLTPAEVLRTGRIDRVEAALEALDSGIFL
jgi:transcriptional regulator with XRE-family HTH domain